MPGEETEKLLNFLKRKSLALKSQLQEIECLLTPENLNALDEATITVQLEQVETIYKEFGCVHSKLEQEDIDEIGGSCSKEVAAIYIHVKTELTRLLITRHASGVRSSTMFPQQSFEGTQPSYIVAPPRQRLPALQIPKFIGVYTDWPDFYSMFDTIVGSDINLTKIEKFQHLRTCLGGCALETIRSLEINEENYEKAIEILIKRFDNKRLNFQAHIRDIVALSATEAGSVTSLRFVSDSINSHLRALLTMGTKEQIADCLLIHIISRKLDITTQTRWEEATPVNTIPTWESMATFLERRCQMMENVDSALVTQTPSKQVGVKMYQNLSNKKSAVITSVNSPKTCSICKSDSHSIFNCQKFISLAPTARFKEAKRLQLCLNCLRSGHLLKNCQSGCCRHCSLKHHTLLHLDATVSSSTNPNTSHAVPVSTSIISSIASLSVAPTTSASTSSAPVAASSTSQWALVAASLFDSEVDSQIKNAKNFVFLATAIVFIKNKVGSLIPCRAILDSASQAHFITSNLAGQLQLKTTKTTTYISGIGQSDFISNKIVNLHLQSTSHNFSTSISAVIVPNIVDNQPSYTICTSDISIPANIQLADPLFFKSQRIDLLIGADLFYDLMCVGQIRLGPQSPILQKTKLGWIVAGSINSVADRRACFITTEQKVVEHDSNFSLDELVKRFWEVENNLDINAKVTKEEQDCEKHFVESYTRLSCGSYSVQLPLKESVSSLGDSYHQALHRFKNLERRLTLNPELKEQYSSFLKEYLELRHMSPVTHIPDGVVAYFLPHHCVIKEDSTTTKLRVVFDGSARTSSGKSLNEVCMVGPTIQSSLFDILLRFRSFKIALTGDICKMYRCVKVAYPDNYLQCILWREKPEDKIKIFKLDTVTYGTKPAAFLSVRAMHQLALDDGHMHPVAARVLRRDFYVDDLISGGDSVQEVTEIMKETTKLLGKGNFKLHKWCSNDSSVLKGVAESDKQQFLKFYDGSEVTKALGLVWDPTIDNFLFSFVPLSSANKITKRTVLGIIARFYDPLGLIGPVIAKAKIFMQLLWKERLDWDESLPQSLHCSWENICAELEMVSRYAFPRLVLSTYAKLEIHSFCDASLSAYGACVYIRSEIDGTTECHLLCSKSRVAPLKSLTVPKLELCAALLLAELVHTISQIDVFKGEFHCWSDSTVVLSWLQEESSNFNIFVSNRIGRIQSLTSQMSWHFVPTQMNPADILSRGATPKELLNSTLWKSGPAYLKQGRDNWPQPPSATKDLPERRKRALILTSKISDLSIDCKYITSFGKIQRVFAYIYKFGAAKGANRAGPLTTKDIQLGTYMLIRMVQKSVLAVEYRSLEDKKPLQSSCHLLSLNPFLDSFGLMRVGGRLQNSALDFESRHPIILPKEHPLTDSAIEYYHHRCIHAGPQALLATIRMLYWPIGGRKTVSRVVNRCVRCFRVRPKLVQHIMGSLPAERVQANRPFLITGVDFAGPLYYRSDIRNRPPIKCYISLFICFSTKAVHLELVNNLSTASFLAALKRFVCTRGRPKTLWSDNATNFVGAKNELIELKKLFLSQDHIKTVEQHCLEDGIEWQFIPPRSPHFGGLWEASIKIAKLHLLRTVGLSILTYDELRTLICQICAIMNSRPLCPISEKADDLEVLTPAHFLIGAPFTSVVEPDVSLLNIHRLDRWQRVCHMQQHFWKKWSTEYITLLQQRTKWQLVTQNINIGAIVLLKDENLPPLKWPLARVVDVIKGEDGTVRVAMLRTSNGLVKRAVAKLCVLPNDSDSVGSAHLPTGAGCSDQKL